MRLGGYRGRIRRRVLETGRQDAAAASALGDLAVRAVGTEAGVVLDRGECKCQYNDSPEWSQKHPRAYTYMYTTSTYHTPAASQPSVSRQRLLLERGVVAGHSGQELSTGTAGFHRVYPNVTNI